MTATNRDRSFSDGTNSSNPLRARKEDGECPNPYR
jgi:hypothetical protein